MKRTMAILTGSSILLMALLAGTGQAAKACKPFKPVAPSSPSTDPSGAVDAEVVKVSEKMTEAKPLVIEFDHAPALADAVLPQMIAEDPKFFNFQVATKKAVALLTFRTEWAAPSPSDIDAFVYNSSGAELASSVAFNPFGGTPVGDAFGMDDDGNGFEQIADIGLPRCAGVTFESRPSTSPGETMTLKVWVD